MHQCIFFFCLYSCCGAQFCANYLFWHCFFPCFSRLFPQTASLCKFNTGDTYTCAGKAARAEVYITHLKHGGARTISDNTLSEEFGTKVALWAVGERGFLHTSWDRRITKASFCCGRAVRFPKASDPSISQRSRAVATKIAISDGYLLQLA